jgi:DNA topoisomerase-1
MDIFQSSVHDQRKGRRACFPLTGISQRDTHQTFFLNQKYIMNDSAIPVLEIQKSSLRKVADDPVESAKLFKLVYIADVVSGITRKRSGNNFRYFLNEKEIEDKENLARLKKLAIPPAWQNVWICKKENGHLQATGIDIKQRKQYRYHALWNKMRSETKYFRLYEFGKNLPALREQLEKDVAIQGLHLNKILATIVLLMERTSIRIGNSFYEKLYGSFGLTTLKNRHVNIQGSNIRFEFKGKKGVHHTISLRSKRLAGIVKKCLDIPGKELFQFYDDVGNIHPIDSGMVNEYIRKISSAEFSSKDFRTWAGTIFVLETCREKGDYEEENEMKHKMIEILDEVAKHLGNTRTVCKKYYVHPLILELYETHKLGKYLDELKAPINSSNESGYTPEEKVLMKILESDSKAVKVIEIPA